MSNPATGNSGKNPAARKRVPFSSSGKPHNKWASGTMNTGNNKFAAPWETYNLTFRSFEEGVPVVESLIKQIEKTNATPLPG